MKTIKIIDLLNKIANGEEPKIKYDNVILKYNKKEERFIDKDGLNSLYELDFSELNDEVEIIEENKLPKKYTTSSIHDIDNLDDKVALIHVDLICVNDKVNKIIDYLESKETGE